MGCFWRCARSNFISRTADRITKPSFIRNFQSCSKNGRVSYGASHFWKLCPISPTWLPCFKVGPSVVMASWSMWAHLSCTCTWWVRATFPSGEESKKGRSRSAVRRNGWYSFHPAEWSMWILGHWTLYGWIVDLDFKREVVQPVYIGMLFHCAPKTKTWKWCCPEGISSSRGPFRFPFLFSGACIMCIQIVSISINRIIFGSLIAVEWNYVCILELHDVPCHITTFTSPNPNGFVLMPAQIHRTGPTRQHVQRNVAEDLRISCKRRTKRRTKVKEVRRHKCLPPFCHWSFRERPMDLATFWKAIVSICDKLFASRQLVWCTHSLQKMLQRIWVIKMLGKVSISFE